MTRLRLSHSAAETFASCPKRYQLRKVIKVQERPMWAGIGGSAVHAATETYDYACHYNATGEPVKFNPQDEFRIAFERQIENTQERSPDYPQATWDATGRATKEWPNKQGKDWWLANGPGMVQAWIDWRTETNWTIAEFPDPETGELTPAIELEVRFTLGDVDVLGYIDRVYRMQDGSLCVLDLKSGSRVPESDMQLGEYATGIELVYGERPAWGCYFMNRKGTATPLTSLRRWNRFLLTSLYNDTKKGIESESFRPKVSNMCKSCSVRDYCAVVGGENAEGYDPLFDLLREETA